MRYRHRYLAAGLAIAFLLGIIALPADAGWFGRGKKKPAPSPNACAPNASRSPRRWSFKAVASGTPPRQWALGNETLILTEHTDIRRLDDPDLPATLTDGAEAYVMGKLRGGVLVCSEVLIVPYVSLATTSWTNQESISWSDSDPTVGEGHGPN